MLDKLSAIREIHVTESLWIFGTQYATALDTHLVPFVARLRDVGRSDMVGETLNFYADCIMVTEMWKKLVGNEGTMYVHGKSRPLQSGI